MHDWTVLKRSAPFWLTVILLNFTYMLLEAYLNSFGGTFSLAGAFSTIAPYFGYTAALSYTYAQGVIRPQDTPERVEVVYRQSGRPMWRYLLDRSMLYALIAVAQMALNLAYLTYAGGLGLRDLLSVQIANGIVNGLIMALCTLQMMLVRGDSGKTMIIMLLLGAVPLLIMFTLDSLIIAWGWPSWTQMLASLLLAVLLFVLLAVAASRRYTATLRAI